MAYTFKVGDLARVTAQGRALAKEGSIVEVVAARTGHSNYVRVRLVLGTIYDYPQRVLQSVDRPDLEFGLFLQSELERIQ